MESEKVKEIKKALECWQESVMLSTDENYVSHKVTNREILDYINELESENERLVAEKQKVLEYMKTDNYAKLKKEDMYWGYQMGICMLEHEIDRQKEQIAELKKKIAKNANCLKQFAEMLRGKAIRRQEFIGELAIDDVKYVKVKDIDETLKEFL